MDSKQADGVQARIHSSRMRVGLPNFLKAAARAGELRGHAAGDVVFGFGLEVEGEVTGHFAIEMAAAWKKRLQ